MVDKLYRATMIILSLAIGILFFAFLIQPKPTIAASIDIIGDNLGINIVESTPLFTMDNMVPGDKEYSSLTIRNEGDAGFLFSIQSAMESGDISLFEALTISVENADGTNRYFVGPISEMYIAKMGPILPGGEKKLSLSVYFPSELGNEYQGKSMSVAFIFTAYTDGDVVDIENEQVPGTTAPANTYIPDDRIPTTGEKVPDVFWIVVLALTMMIMKFVHIMIRFRRRLGM